MTESNNDYIEYTIKIKDEKNSLSEKALCYGALVLWKENKPLKEQVNALAARFMANSESGEPPEIIVSARMVWQS